ncbi:MAG: hypothetical protein IJH67_01560 [Thermoguttaceae bacterium]|nr:hypothetical protein [Thermoguttaceae bacterium]
MSRRLKRKLLSLYVWLTLPIVLFTLYSWFSDKMAIYHWFNDVHGRNILYFDVRIPLVHDRYKTSIKRIKPCWARDNGSFETKNDFDFGAVKPSVGSCFVSLSTQRVYPFKENLDLLPYSVYGARLYEDHIDIQIPDFLSFEEVFFDMPTTHRLYLDFKTGANQLDNSEFSNYAPEFRRVLNVVKYAQECQNGGSKPQGDQNSNGEK